jgi:uncharacterized protein
MDLGTRLAEGATRHARLVILLVIVVTLVIGGLAALPSLVPSTASFLSPVRVDTDPENMLQADEPVRVRNHALKEKFDLNDIIVVGVVNEEDPDGVFNPETLRKVHELTEFALTLHGEAIGAEDGEGVIPRDVIAPSTVDRIEPGEAGEISFSWLMREPPKTAAEAIAIRDAAQRLPFLNNTLVSADGLALAIYLPITEKDLSYRIARHLGEKATALGGPEAFHITGLPVAEDTFGVEMFVQMAISAPLAMLVIFLLMLVFFRKLLVIAGHPVHIMSSMIPIFIMPIAVLDSVHIISEFFDRFQITKDRKSTIVHVVKTLFGPMLYTSLTSAAGFGSLALTPIPPVRVFGIFVALGILVAWFLTIVFVPAFIMLIPPKRLENFGAASHADGERGLLGRFLRVMSGGTYRFAKPILAAGMVILVLAGWGITKINVNDNPVKWFHPSHDIRVADRVLNDHFAGTYMAYLSFTASETEGGADDFVKAVLTADTSPAIRTAVTEAVAGASTDLAAADALVEKIHETLGSAGADEEVPGIDDEVPGVPDGLDGDLPGLPGGLDGTDQGEADVTAGPEGAERAAWESLLGRVESWRQQRRQVFKRPDVLRWMATLQEHLLTITSEDGRSLVGKSNSLADIVATVHRDLYQGTPEQYRIPDTFNAVGQCLSQFENGHRPHDLAHFAPTGGPSAYRDTSLWVQLKTGDNADMSRVVTALDDYLADSPPPAVLEPDPRWFGLTYINVVWQEKMVWGMLEAFGGSFLVVFLLMTALFRSPLWGLLSMIPLTLTIGSIYGVIGIIGKDYDMPVAVLSSLTLGLAVDFSIHFLARSRELYAEHGTWEATLPHVFSEPARAIMRNIIVIAAGFTPLLLAPLLPYRTVGILLATILLVSGFATLVVLPALMRLLEKRLFKGARPQPSPVNATSEGSES